ncbi:MAG: hypothetical protein J7604_06710 [Sporocytophaga sp.]|uniref:hypothetical protein n=1 Tax=Sporocytophaga sp. TaxID=2231183 RepID=UPI001B2D10F1|nr:hypothetical protein [Sporocytophaga sp.]MBO9699885.1 hypothetical protein [Sporocytophaga sp.]
MSFFSFNMIVLAGLTGTGKTLLLERFAQYNYPIIHLEKLAGHKGSVFGDLGIDSLPPDQKTFNASLELVYQQYNASPIVFTEHEAPAIGKRRIPEWFYNLIENGFIIYIDLPKSERIKLLKKEYGHYDPYLVSKAVDKLSDRIPAVIVTKLKEYLFHNDFDQFTDCILNYYDQSNHYVTIRNKAKILLEFPEFNPEEITSKILNMLKQFNFPVL